MSSDLDSTSGDTGTRRERTRLAGLDAVRGLAIVLMLLDHALVLAMQLGDVPALMLVRLTVTRASLPLFMVCSGVLLDQCLPTTRRMCTVAAVALGVMWMTTASGLAIGVPEILGVWLLVMCAARWLVRFPVWAIAAGVVQASTWPIEWHGYQPGVVAALIAAGVLGGPSVVAWGARMPAWAATVGRRPLAWYGGHLTVLCGLAWVLL